VRCLAARPPQPIWRRCRCRVSLWRAKGGNRMSKAGLVAAAAVLALMAAGAQAAPQRNDKVFAAVEANRAGALDLLKQIVNIDSGTGDVAGGTKVAAVLEAQLRALGAAI